MRDDAAGIMQVYCGNGKGKTTAAVGQTVRAVGNGYTVFFIQFLKTRDRSGEIRVFDTLTGVESKSFGTGRFLKPSTIHDDDRKLAQSAIEYVRGIVDKKAVDMLVLDEIGGALELGLITEDAVNDLLERGRGWLDVVLTGRVFPESLLKRADLVTRMNAEKHHIDSGKNARRGIEY